MAYLHNGCFSAFIPLGLVRRNNPEQLKEKNRSRLHSFLRAIKRAARLLKVQGLTRLSFTFTPVKELVQVKDYVDYETDYHGLLLSAGIQENSW